MTYESWSKLEAAERLLCVGNEQLDQKIRGMKAWRSAGCLKERYEDDISSKLTAIFEHKENRSLLQDSKGHGYTFSFALFMLSEKGRQEAIPFIVLFHDEKKKAEKATRLLQENKEMCMFEFSYLVVKGALVLGRGWPPEAAQLDCRAPKNDNLCGRRVLVCTPPIDPGSLGNPATIGGILCFGKESYYALVSAHIFFESDIRQRQGAAKDHDTSASTNTSEQSDADFDLDGMSSMSYVVPKKLVARSIYVVDNQIQEGNAAKQQLVLAESDRHVGNSIGEHKTTATITKSYNPSLDWTLVKIRDPRFWRSTNTIRLSESYSLTPRPGYNKKAPPVGKLIVLSGPAGFKECTGLGIKSSISLPWSDSFVSAWMLSCELDVGASGSWVIEPASGTICGIVITGRPGTGLSWMLPADPVFRDVLEKRRDSYEVPQDVFQIPRIVPIELEINKANITGEFAGDPAEAEPLAQLPEITLAQASPSVGLADNAARSNFISPTMQEFRRTYDRSVVSSDPSHAPMSASDTRSEPESSTTTFSMAQRLRADQRSSSAATRNSILQPEIASDFVYKCGDGFAECFAFMKEYPHVLSVPAETFIAAAAAAQTNHLDSVARSCVTRAILLQDYTSRIAVQEVLQAYFEPLTSQDPAAVKEFWDRRSQMLAKLKERSGSSQPQ